MKKRRILIIHESGTFRNILKRTLNAELADVDLHLAPSAKEAINRLETEAFDMVISANEMEHMNGTVIFEKIKEMGVDKQVGFLLLTSKLDKENRTKFKSAGIENILKLPFQAGNLAQTVENLSNPRDWRRHRRIDIPGTRVLIRLDGTNVSAEIANLSMGGMLSDIKASVGIPKFSRFYKFNILFPMEYENVRVSAEGYILRQAALQWLEPPAPDIIQSAWRFSLLSDLDTEVMEQTISKAFRVAEAQEASISS